LFPSEHTKLHSGFKAARDKRICNVLCERSKRDVRD